MILLPPPPCLYIQIKSLNQIATLWHIFPFLLGETHEPPCLWSFPEAAVFKIFSHPWLCPGPGVGLRNGLLSATLSFPSYGIPDGLPETFLLLRFSCLRFLLRHQDSSLRKQSRGLGQHAPEVSPSSSPQAWASLPQWPQASLHKQGFSRVAMG